MPMKCTLSYLTGTRYAKKCTTYEKLYYSLSITLCWQQWNQGKTAKGGFCYEDQRQKYVGRDYQRG